MALNQKSHPGFGNMSSQQLFPLQDVSIFHQEKKILVKNVIFWYG